MVFSITEDFPLSTCLFFQIAGKDINNISFPPKLGKKLLEDELVDWDGNSGLLLPSLLVKRVKPAGRL